MKVPLGSLAKMEVKEERLYTIESQPPELHDLPPRCSFSPPVFFVVRPFRVVQY